LLAFARKQTTAPQVLALNQTVGGMLKMLRRLIGEEIELVWKPRARHDIVKLDPSQVDQVLANLCVNARDAIRGVGTITIETEDAYLDEAFCAEHVSCKPGHFVQLSVSDTGGGMTPEVVSRVFEPFFTTKGVGKGSGLGLAMVHGIVHQNAGAIVVHTELGHGSAFRLYLPRHVKGDAALARAAAQSHHPGRGETVLLVEDEPSLRVMSQTMLERLGYRVLPARLPSLALELAQLHPGNIHLLVTDVIMPEMNGRELLVRLRERLPALACLYISGYPADVIAHHGVLDSEVHFLPKPFSFGELAAKVSDVLSRERASEIPE
jgi:CheY-like chemotaxis protein